MPWTFKDDVLSNTIININGVDSKFYGDDFREKRTWIMDGVHKYERTTFSPVAEVEFSTDEKGQPMVLKIIQTCTDYIQNIRNNDLITHVNKKHISDYSSVPELAASMDIRVSNARDAGSSGLKEDVYLTLIREIQDGYQQVELRVAVSWEKQRIMKSEAKTLTCNPISEERKILIKNPIQTNKSQKVVLSMDKYPERYMTLTDRKLTTRPITDDSEISNFEIDLHYMKVVYKSNVEMRDKVCCAIEIGDHWVSLQMKRNKVKPVTIKKRHGDSVDTWPKDDPRIFKFSMDSGVNGDKVSFESLPFRNVFLTCMETNKVVATKPKVRKQGEIRRCETIVGTKIPEEAWFKIAPKNIPELENTTTNDTANTIKVDIENTTPYDIENATTVDNPNTTMDDTANTNKLGDENITSSDNESTTSEDTSSTSTHDSERVEENDIVPDLRNAEENDKSLIDIPTTTDGAKKSSTGIFSVIFGLCSGKR